MYTKQRVLELIWYKHSWCINITKCSKAWWNEECQMKLVKYRSSKKVEDWKAFKETIKKMKRLFFDDKIQEIVSKNQKLWNLIN